MISAPVPANEAQRLEALQKLEILDSHPEASFDRITNMAARHFGVPICIISLVDERREWFKSACGLTIQEGARSVAFCAHAILGREVLVIEDTLLDTRFRDNPLVAAANGIRFYAGAPLIDGADMRLGALCLKDTRPRSFNVQERWMLAQYADLVVDLLEFRLVARAVYVQQSSRTE